VPNVPTDDRLLIAPTDDYGMDELRRSPWYRTALWFDRMGYVFVVLWLVAVFAYESIAVSILIFAVGLVLEGAVLVLRRRAGVPSIRPRTLNAAALYRWRQYRRDVYWLPRR
jgi:hypothetical protein